VIVIRFSQDGHTVEVSESMCGFPLSKFREFKYYDKALSFAENLAVESDSGLTDYVKASLESDTMRSGTTVEDKLLKAIFGEER